jgi:hypothetical protein
MRRLLRLLCCAALAFGLGPARTGEPPRLDEVLEVVRTHLAGGTEAELNAAAVNGLLEQLRPRVFLVTNTPPDPAAEPPVLLARTNLFDGAIASLRVGRVARGLAGAIRATLEAWSTTTTLQGLVLDLRFTEGEDFAAAGRVADLFVAEPQALLEWGDERFKATAKTNALPLRLAVLVNRETRGAAEALAAALHEVRAGLILGSPTAGQAAVYREFPLSTGQRLKVAVAHVKVGPGGKTLAFSGLTPDIQVEVPPADERRYVEDPFYIAATTGPRSGAGSRAPRLTEADLVRIHREGLGSAGARTRREETPPAPRVTDPVLQRALDLLKGLAVLETREQ